MLASGKGNSATFSFIITKAKAHQLNHKAFLIHFKDVAVVDQ